MLNISYIGLRFTFFFISFFFLNPAMQGMCLNEEWGESSFKREVHPNKEEEKEDSIVAIHIDSFFYTIRDIEVFLSSRYTYSYAEVELPMFTLYLSKDKELHIGPQGGDFYCLRTEVPLILRANFRSSITLFPSGKKVHFSSDVVEKILSASEEIFIKLRWDPELLMYRL